MTRQRFACIFVFVALLILAEAHAGEGVRRKIGVVVPLSGPLAHFGDAVKNGVTLADATHDGSDRIQFIFEDDQYQPRSTVLAVRKLLEREKVDGLILFGSGPSLAAAPIAEQGSIPTLAISTSPAVARGRRYVFKHFPTIERETEAVVGEVKRRGYRTVAVVTTANEAMHALRDEFLKSVKAALELDVLPDDTDLRSVATKVAAAKPEAVYNLLMPPQGGLFAKLLRENQFAGEIFSGHQLEDLGELKASQGALVGSWLVSTAVVKDRSFIDSYRAAYRRDPENFAVNGYDAAKIFIDTADAPVLIDRLRSLNDFHGMMGSYTVTPQNEFDIGVVLKRVTPEGFEPLS